MYLLKKKAVTMFTSIINASELASILYTENVVIIDCRFSLTDTESGRKEYKESHIPKAIYAHLDYDLSGTIVKEKTGRHPFPDINTFAAKCGSWGIDASKQVVVYDQGNGGIAARLWFLLKWLGHENVAVLNGGWQYWQAQAFPTDKTISIAAPSIFSPQANMNMLVAATVLENNLKEATHLVFDARSIERYRGEEEPIDPVAGHIPNAISAPFTANLGKDGLFLSKEQLQKRFKELLKEHPLEKTIFYCGSGVTACHNLLSLHYIGQKDAKLFPGSWSEWITDPKRPVATILE